MSVQRRDWRELSYLTNPEHLSAFQEAEVVDAHDADGRWRAEYVYDRPILPEVTPGDLSLKHGAPLTLDVPIFAGKGENLRMLLDACVALKGGHDYDMSDKRRLLS